MQIYYHPHSISNKHTLSNSYNENNKDELFYAIPHYYITLLYV
jgi:hypothetical protein